MNAHAPQPPVVRTPSSMEERHYSRKRPYDDNDAEDSKPAAVPTMADIRPKVGMRLELRDGEYIWCPVRIRSVDNEGGEPHVTVHFDGWGDSFDERVPWSSERLAPIYSFTKSVKCFFDALPKQKKRPPGNVLDALPPKARRIYSNLWPCKVQFRMPHPVVEGSPDEETCLYAEEFLRQETNIFVQPYDLMLLPKDVRLMFDKDGGGWLNSRRLRAWKDDVTELGVLPDGIVTAFESALNDVETPGTLSVNAVEKGSLLKANFRIHGREGAPVRDGSLQFCNDLLDRLVDELSDGLIEEADETTVKLAAGVQVRHPTPPPEVTKQEDSDEEFEPLEPVDPPFLPVPIQITDSIYPGCGVRKCKRSNQYVASISLGANDVFLGSFPTQTQAYQATRLAAGEDIKMETDLQKARLADLAALPLESIVNAMEKQWNPKTNKPFSLHDWSLQKIRHAVYIEAVRKSEAVSDRDHASTMQVHSKENSGQKARTKRKGIPRRVDLVTCTYITPEKNSET